jgi:predicted DNA-binding protein (UPF0251 family)
MKEITTMPVKVSNGDKEIEVYESEGGFCMTTEFLGKCLGYAKPGEGMGQLFKRHKAVLKGHRFRITGDTKPQGGRPSFFYDEVGILKTILLAGTDAAKEFGLLLIDRLQTLRLQKTVQLQDEVIYLTEELRKKRSRRPNLTQKEIVAFTAQLLKLKAEGLSQNKAAGRLGISKSTACNLLKYGNCSGRLKIEKK